MIARNLLYTIMLLHVCIIGVCQDLIINRDSSRIQAIVIKVGPQEITYTAFPALGETEIKILKNKVSKIIFRNGTEIIFNPIDPLRTDTTLTYFVKKKKVLPEKYDTLRVGDFIKLNLQAGIIVYNSFCNVPRKNDLQMTSSREYLKARDKENVTFNVGFNFLFGKSPYVKHVIGANYLRTKAEYYYSAGNLGGSVYSRNTSTTDFINVTTGLRFTVFRKLHLEPLVSFNFVAYGLIRSSGTHTSVNSNTRVWTTTSFENTSTVPDVGNTVSISPKISYDIPFRSLKAETYLSYNLAYRYKLPWYQFGVHIYLFKKLR